MASLSFKKYLADTGVVEVLTGVVLQLQTEFDTTGAPEDPVAFVSSFFSKELEAKMKEHQEQSSAKIAVLEKKLEDALAKVTALEEEKAEVARVAREAEEEAARVKSEAERLEQDALAAAASKAEAIFDGEPEETQAGDGDEGAEIFGEKEEKKE